MDSAVIISQLGSALKLLELGFSVIPIGLRDKGPKLAGWQNLRLTQNELQGYFGNGPSNIGVLLGVNREVDIDLDCWEAACIAEDYLPETGCIFGRKSAPAAHWVYRITEPIPSFECKDPVSRDRPGSKQMIVEFRCLKHDGSIGKQTVFPSSIHKESGELIEWASGCNGRPEETSAEVLTSAVKRISGAVLLYRELPPEKSGRNEYFLALGGALAKHGWPLGQAYQLMKSVWQLVWRRDFNEGECRAQLQATFTKFESGDAITGIPRLKELAANPKAISRALEWLSIGEETLDSREVVVRLPRHLCTADAMSALVAANDPPKLFVRGGRYVRLAEIETDRRLNLRTVIVQDIDKHHMRGRMERSARYVALKTKKVDGEERIVKSPSLVPMDLVLDLMSLPPEDSGIPKLTSVVESPVILHDGRVLTEPGYDVKSGIYYAAQSAFRLAPMRETPTREDAILAREYLENEVLADFPFENTASLHNSLAAMVTVIARDAITGPTPIALIDATTAGTGKGLLTEVISLIASGHTPSLSSYPENDEEFRKAITSALLRNPGAMIVFDNVTGTLKSRELDKALTATVWADRILGESKTVELPVRATWFANGNNLDIAGDVARRSYWVRMNAACVRPDERSDFRHQNLSQWVKDNRGALVAALLTICRAWFVAGRPAGLAPRIGSFESWTEVVGGIMYYAGADEFLGNRKELRESVDSETEEWALFLDKLRSDYGDAAFTTRDLVKRFAFASESDLPVAVASALDKKGASRNVSLGKVLKYRRERRYGRNGLYLKPAGKACDNSVKWKVTEDYPLSA
jgi:hypothetical protein